MNEYIDISLLRNGRRIAVKRQVPGGIELDEREPIARRVDIGFKAADEITAYRMGRVRQVRGWENGLFKLKVTVEDGSIVLRGDDRFSLPEGQYLLTLNIDEARTRPVKRRVSVPHDGFGRSEIVVELDDRALTPKLEPCDAEVARILAASRIDGEAAVSFVGNETHRPERRACLLNVLASLRVRPSSRAHLASLVRDVFAVKRDRIYAKVDRAMFDTVMRLVLDPKKPFYSEGRPTADIHQHLLDCLPEPPARRALFPREKLVSFRGEGKPALQMVIVEPPAGCDYTYAEFDIDLGNPLQDVGGFVVHMGELLNGTVTDHLDLRKALGRGPAGPFLYYAVA